LRIDPNNLTNPWYAASASALAFTVGAVIPVLVMAASPRDVRIPATFVSVAIALLVTGAWSAYIGGANKTKATVRVVLGGLLAMLVTFGIGRLFGVSGV
jgi:VIT1/CCC1 family predicted Fe2+/Mn2+ transporter